MHKKVMEKRKKSRDDRRIDSEERYWRSVSESGYGSWLGDIYYDGGGMVEEEDEETGGFWWRVLGILLPVVMVGILPVVVYEILVIFYYVSGAYGFSEAHVVVYRGERLEWLLILTAAYGMIGILVSVYLNMKRKRSKNMII